MEAEPNAARNGTRVPVLYIVGYGRSGSTLIDNVLNEVDGFFSTGELRNIWSEGLKHRRKCGCGALIPDCPVWAPVLSDVLGNRVDSDMAERIISWRRGAVRQRHFLRLLYGKDPSGEQPSSAYSHLLYGLYRSIQAVTGAHMIVDSSKAPADAALISRRSDIDLFLLHLVRDPRAVSYSWRRRKKRLDDPLGDEELPRYGVFRSASHWTAFNLMAEAIGRRVGPGRYLRLRYEDFVGDPDAAIQTIMDFAGRRPTRVPVVDDRRVLLRGNHSVGGNPSRFRRGAVEVRADNEWKAHQAPAEKVMIALLASWGFVRYGYRRTAHQS